MIHLLERAVDAWAQNIKESTHPFGKLVRIQKGYTSENVNSKIGDIYKVVSVKSEALAVIVVKASEKLIETGIGLHVTMGGEILWSIPPCSQFKNQEVHLMTTIFVPTVENSAIMRMGGLLPSLAMNIMKTQGTLTLTDKDFRVIDVWPYLGFKSHTSRPREELIGQHVNHSGGEIAIAKQAVLEKARDSALLEWNQQTYSHLWLPENGNPFTLLEWELLCTGCKADDDYYILVGENVDNQKVYWKNQAKQLAQEG
ncbi:MAG: hypothetical protein AAF810_01360 [Cyanobacteria bacterium P01_D01_bin.36]